LKINLQNCAKELEDSVKKNLDLMNEIANQKLEFSIVNFNLFELDTFDLEMFNRSNVIYLFKIKDWGTLSNGSELCKLIVAMKADKRNPKLPKVNTENKDGILYVGKSTGNFKTRLAQHLGGKSPSTYALHLSSWKDNLKTIELELHYAVVDFDSMKINTIDAKEVLELLETALHHQYKPLLGRSGH
jgi:hypothetical protein